MTNDSAVPTWRWLLGVYIAPAALLILVLVVSLVTDRPVGDFVRDPAGIARMPPFLGLVSNLGILLWCAAATVALFAAVLLRNYAVARPVIAFFVSYSAFTAVLMADDLFMLHERMLPNLLGIPEPAVVLSYPVILAFMLYFFRAVYAPAPRWFLVSALGLFVCSVGIDFVEEQIPAIPYLVEDGFKFLGIASWLAWLVQVARYYIVRTLKTA